jgi:hypothetical protein
MLIHLDGKQYLCDVVVSDTLARSNLDVSTKGPARLANAQARKKEAKYSNTTAALHAVHLPFSVETMGGLSRTAMQLIREIHHSADTHCTWRDASGIGAHLLDCIAISVQRCVGMALRASIEMEARVALGAAAA